MIDKKELFKIYNFKTWKQSKFQIFLSITAIAIAAAILISLKLVIALNTSYTYNNAKSINDGDINIPVPAFKITGEQLNTLEKLKDQGKIKYTATYKMMNNFTNADITNVIEVKFIDSSYSYINKRVGMYAERLGNHKVLINRALADKFQIKKGDAVSLQLKGLSISDEKFEVEDIVESTDVLDEDVLGAIILGKSDLQTDEKLTNINVIVDKKDNFKDILAELEKTFSSSGHLKTYEEGLKSNKNILDKEVKAADLIQILVVIITGTGISLTILLLILKRKKDYVLLSIYGMKEKMLQDMILLETFIICNMGVIAGIFLSFIITGIIERNILAEMDTATMVKAGILPLLMTVVFIIAQTMIFTMLPVTISKGIKPNAILRQEEQKFTLNEDYSSPVFRMIILMAVCFSVYVGSLKTGLMYISIMLALIFIIYGLSIGGIYLVSKIKAKRNKFMLLAIRNIGRQKNRVALSCTSLAITLIFCGIIVNLGQTIIPGIVSGISDDIGYNITVSTNFKKENISDTESVLSKEDAVKKYIKTINTTGRFKAFNGKNLDEFINNQKFSQENEKPVRDFFNGNVNIEALDISKDMLSYNTMNGRWFKSSDIDKNYVVLGESLNHYGINVNDEVSIDIQGKTYKFTVIGACSSSNFRDNSCIYIDINSIKDNSSIGDSNSKLQYLIQDNPDKQKELTLTLTKKLRNAVVLDERDRFNELSKYIQKLTYVFILICFISVFSAVCLIGNILMIINFERLREFLILNVVGAKNRDIRRVTIIEGIIIGGVAGITGCLISEFLSYLLVAESFSCKYSFNYRADLIMFFSAIALTTAASLLAINNMKLEKYTELLRAD